MAVIIRWPRNHARAPSASTGRGRVTSDGQATSSGQRSENQPITSSYLRAVNVVSFADTRSKKRQSPAAKRPRVVKLRLRAKAYAEAQAMRFDRSSVSILEDNSRSFPTVKQKVGNFQLADNPDMSDKSDMRETDRIRWKIQTAIEAAGFGAVNAAEELGWPRDHLRDYLEGRKESLKAEKLMQLSERFGIPFNDLIPGGGKKQTG